MSQHSVKFDEDKRHGVYDRDGYKCHYCGKHDSTKTGVGLSIDHIDSRAGGGDAQNTKHSPGTNLITACHGCNFAKQDKSPREWNAYIKNRVPPDGGLKVDWKTVRKQATKPIDIKAGEAGAKRAREARADRASKAAGPGVHHDPSNGQFTSAMSMSRRARSLPMTIHPILVAHAHERAANAWIGVGRHDGLRIASAHLVVAGCFRRRAEVLAGEPAPKPGGDVEAPGGAEGEAA